MPTPTNERTPLREYLSLSEVAELLPSRPAPSTVWRWVQGLSAGNGERVHLKAARFGRRWYVRRTDLEAFGRALAEASLPSVRR